MVTLEQTDLFAVATFEKVSFEQFVLDEYCCSVEKATALYDIDKIRQHYDSIKLPTRATAGSAGYDFYAPHKITVHPNTSFVLSTGIRAKIQPGWVLMLFPRSGLGFKYGIRLLNTTGIIDSDYYNAANEGHIMTKMISDFDVDIREGDRFMQGILLPYGIATNDKVISAERNGGMGSTGK